MVWATRKIWLFRKEEWNNALNRINPKDKPPTAKAYGMCFERDGIAPIEKYEYLETSAGFGFLARQIAGGEYRVLGVDNNALVVSDSSSLRIPL